MRKIAFKLTNFIEKIVQREKYGASDTITIDIPSNLYYKNLAVYTAVGIIANAISMSEIQTFLNNEEVKESDYYKLNVSPNVNQTSSQFWHKVIEQMLAGPNNYGEALVVASNDCLYCADSFYVNERRPFLGNTYTNVTIDTLSLNKTYQSGEVYLFKLSNQSIIELLDDMYSEYSKILESAANAFMRGNGKKYKLHLTGVKAGDEEFNKLFEERLKEQLQSYMKSDNAVYPEFDGYSLDPDSSISHVSADEMLKVRKDMFDMVAAAYKIPASLMNGNITNINDIIDEFLTFAVDPIADMMAEVLNKRAGFDNWKNGNYYRVKTSGIFHRDIFSLAPNIDKLISSGFANIDEVRREANWMECNEDWSRQHWMTKNYSKIEELLKELMESKGKEETDDE